MHPLLRSVQSPAAGARSPRRRSIRLGLLPALLGLLVLPGVLGLTGSPSFADEKEGDAASAPNPPAADRAKKSLLPDVKANLKAYKGLVEAARCYFDLDEQRWKGRKGFLDALTAQVGDGGKYFLKDMDALRWLAAQSRSFHPPFTDRKWRNSQGIPEYRGLGGTLHWIKSEYLTVAFSIPRSYPKEKDMRSKYPRVEPYPLLLTMHEKRDYTGHKYPGEVLLKRRYPKKPWADLYANWLVLCPVAAAGNYLSSEGMLRAEVFLNPYAIFWKHYHVDFQRVILDGTKHAFSAAGTVPTFFAGIVFRAGKGKKWGIDTDAMKADVRNFASVPVYVVDHPKLAEQLKEAGHPNVTAGIGGASLFKWMGERRRVEPKKFSWAVQRQDQVLPYWVNLDSPNWSAPTRTLDVEVIDSETEPNTIKITARGINTLSLFLNDDIVSLDEKVRVIINGHIMFDGMLEPERPAMKTLGRDFDILFDTEPARIRISMFFGWLKAARVVQLAVRAPEVKKPENGGGTDNATPVTTTPATATEEALAKRQWRRAMIFLDKGLTDKAKEALEKIAALPPNKYTDKATEQLKLLGK